VVSGGSAPAHSMAIARKLGIAKVIIPPACGVASAVGMLKAELSFETLQSYRVALEHLSVDEFITQFQNLDERIQELLSQGGGHIHEYSVSRRLDMRYLGQGFEVEIELPGADLSETYRSLSKLFHQCYESQYSSSFPEQALEIINWKVEIISSEANTQSTLIIDEYKEDKASLKTKRKVYSPISDSREEWPVYNRYSLRPGQSLCSPLLIEDNESTAVFFKDDLVEVDEDLNLIASPAY
jgi:N-methylhydantoinase A